MPATKLIKYQKKMKDEKNIRGVYIHEQGQCLEREVNDLILVVFLNDAKQSI